MISLKAVAYLQQQLYAQWLIQCIIFTFIPLWNTESLQTIHEFFLKPRAVRGKCVFSGDWHVTPHISDDTQRGL